MKKCLSPDKVVDNDFDYPVGQTTSYWWRPGIAYLHELIV